MYLEQMLEGGEGQPSGGTVLRVSAGLFSTPDDCITPKLLLFVGLGSFDRVGVETKRAKHLPKVRSAVPCPLRLDGKRRTGREDPQLSPILRERKSESVQEQAQQIGDLCSRCSTLEVEFIKDQVEV
jgi:hypothetical protein